MQSRFRSAVDLVAGIAMIATAGVVLWAKLATPPPPPPPQPPPPPPGDAVPAEPQSLAGAQVKGSPNARIGIIEYADFECPACGSFVQRTYGDLVAKYVDTGKVRLFFRHFPLPNHQFARSAAVGAHCAGEQGKFWDLYERVFTLQPRLDDAGLRAAARKAGVEPSAWSRCIASDGAGDVVDASRLNHEVRGLRTPAGRAAQEGENQGLSHGAHPMASAGRFPSPTPLRLCFSPPQD